MNILLLGPRCTDIESHLLGLHHNVSQTELPVDLPLLEKWGVDFVISYRYRHIIREAVVTAFCGRLINLHISFLPWNRGSDPNLWSFLEDTPKGVSIHAVSMGLDEGDLLLQQSVTFDMERATLASSYSLLLKTIEILFITNSTAILSQSVKPFSQPKKGTLHRSKDKEQYLYLLEEQGWDTPVKTLVGRAL